MENHMSTPWLQYKALSEGERNRVPPFSLKGEEDEINFDEMENEKGNWVRLERERAAEISNHLLYSALQAYKGL